MSEFFNTYIDLGGPAVLAGVVVGSLVYLLFGGRDLRVMFTAGGIGVLAGMVSAAIQAGFGVTGAHMPMVAAVAAGAAGGYMLSPARRA